MLTPTTTAQPSASAQLTLGSCSPGGSWPVIFFQPKTRTLRVMNAAPNAARVATTLVAALSPSSLSDIPAPPCCPVRPRPSAAPPVDHYMAVPPARAAGRAELIAAASSAGWRVATSQYGALSACSVTLMCGRHRRHLSRPRRTVPDAGPVTSTYTA